MFYDVMDSAWRGLWTDANNIYMLHPMVWVGLPMLVDDVRTPGGTHANQHDIPQRRQWQKRYISDGEKTNKLDRRFDIQFTNTPKNNDNIASSSFLYLFVRQQELCSILLK